MQTQFQAPPRPRLRPSRRGGGWLRSFLLLLLIALGVAGAAFILAQTQPAEEDYLVAAQTLPAGAVLSADRLDSVTLLAGSVAGAIPASQQDSVVGRVVSRELVQGDLVQMSHLCQSASVTCQLLPETAGETPTLLFRLGTQGVLFPAGLQPGDKVDLFLVSKDASGPCTADLVAGLQIMTMDPDGSSMTFRLASEVVRLIVTAQNTGSLVITGAAPTELFQVLSNGTVACPDTSSTGSPGATPTPQA